MLKVTVFSAVCIVIGLLSILFAERYARFRREYPEGPNAPTWAWGSLWPLSVAHVRVAGFVMVTVGLATLWFGTRY